MASTGTAAAVPEVALRSGNARPLPMVGMGTALSTPMADEATKNAVLSAIEMGFRHLDTAFIYGTEKPLGEAVAEAIHRGLLQSREELFVTPKLWCSQSHPDLVPPSLRGTLKNMQMEYLDLYLVHWPVCVNGPPQFPLKEDAVPFDLEGVWRAMEECQRLGLAKAIGVSNFTTKHLDRILAVATIPPAVNQVELSPVWQQRTLRAYCADRGIHVVAYSSLGGHFKWIVNGLFEEKSRIGSDPILARIATRGSQRRVGPWIVRRIRREGEARAENWATAAADREKDPVSTSPSARASPTSPSPPPSRSCRLGPKNLRNAAAWGKASRVYPSPLPGASSATPLPGSHCGATPPSPQWNSSPKAPAPSPQCAPHLVSSRRRRRRVPPLPPLLP